ncbi:MAG: helix-turn-helix domain-containing protein [Muribaculaceae bacterium]|nr:helix-turn-helix domain-containing protein [Muribaculaceae bacterium]
MSRLVKLGQNIKKYRKMKNLSQNEFAEMINFSREHLACIETGKEYISLRKLFMVADSLEVPLTQLINFD